MDGIREQIKRYFNEGDTTARLILINLGVFIFFYLLNILDYFFQIHLADNVIQWLALPTDLGKLITRPWSIITYMFVHGGFFHIFFNMLFLYMFGRLYMQYLGGRSFLSTYLLGGIAGGILYVIMFNIFPVFADATPFSKNIGASAGVMAIVIATAAYNPNFEVKLFFTLRVKIWWAAALFVVSDLIYLPGKDDNVGGHIAHIGGAILGYIVIRQLKKGKDITAGFSRLMDNLANMFKAKPKVRKVYSNPKQTRTDDEYNTKKVSSQQHMNEILDKISRSGYESLSKEEKDYLFKIGKD